MLIITAPVHWLQSPYQADNFGNWYGDLSQWTGVVGIGMISMYSWIGIINYPSEMKTSILVNHLQPDSLL